MTKKNTLEDSYLINKLSSPNKWKDSSQRFGLNAVLQLSEFRKLWIGQIFSQLADKFYIVLMVYLIAQYWLPNITQGSESLAEIAEVIRMDLETRAQWITLLATGIYIANTIPAMFLGTFAGMAADRWPKRKIMVFSNVFRAILVLLVPICIKPGPNLIGISWGYWALLIMTFFESVLTQFFAPAEQATIPLLVPKKHLLAANSLYQATAMGATIMGFALGDPILRILNQVFSNFGMIGGEFFLLPFCYGMAAISISKIRLKEVSKILNSNNIFKEFKESLRVLKEKPSVKKAMINLVLLYSLLAALYVLTISLASSIKELGPTKFGYLLSLSGLGMTIGAIFLAQIGNHFNRRKLTAFGLCLISFTLVLLGHFKGSLILTFSLCALLGIGAALIAIPAQTTIQEDTPKNLYGKIFGLQNNLINIALSLPLVITGALISRYELVPVLWLLASVAFLATLLERPWESC